MDELDFTYHVKEKAYNRQRGLCGYCGNPLRVSYSFNRYGSAVQGEAHHIMPKKNHPKCYSKNFIKSEENFRTT